MRRRRSRTGSPPGEGSRRRRFRRCRGRGRSPKRAERRAHLVPVPALGVRMRMQVEVAVAPADEQSEGEEHDQRGDRGLGSLLHPLGDESLREEDRDTEDDERDPVTDAPPGAELAADRATRSRPDATRVVIAAMWSGSVACRRPSRTATRRTTTTDAPSENPAIQSSSPNMSLDSFGRAPIERPVRSEPVETPGSARAVMTTPTARMSAALTAGSARTSGPSSEIREKAGGRKTATRPIAVIVAARPTLKATISASPSPTRCSAIAERSTTSADGHGRSPAATPTPRIPFDVRAWSWW